MPLVNNLYVYRDNNLAPPILVLHGHGIRTITGDYISVIGKIQSGQQIEKGSKYRICEGAAFNPENNHGTVKFCKQIDSVEGGNPQQPDNYAEKNSVRGTITAPKTGAPATVIDHPVRQKWFFGFERKVE